MNDGTFGLCRVIGHGGRKPRQYKSFKGDADGCFRVLVTRWVGGRKELDRALADPRAKSALIPSFVPTHKGKPYVTWTTQPPPATFVPVGTLLPTPKEQKLEGSDIVWEWMPMQIKAQLEYEADPAAYVEKRRKALEPKPVEPQPARMKPRGKPPTLATLARRKPFADWDAKLRTRARERITTLIATLREKPRQAVRDLRAITACAKSFNREREMGTLEAESLDDVLLEIAWAVGIDVETYGREIDAVRDW